MDQHEFIRTAHRVYGKNISELSRMTEHSRNTVIRCEHWKCRERKNQPFSRSSCQRKAGQPVNSI